MALFWKPDNINLDNLFFFWAFFSTFFVEKLYKTWVSF